MKIVTLHEFRGSIGGRRRSKKPILVTRRARLVGIFFPVAEGNLPLELKCEMFPLLSSKIARQLRKRRIDRAEVLADFDRWRTGKHETGRTRAVI
jgi:hypothetical protein